MGLAMISNEGACHSSSMSGLDSFSNAVCNAKLEYKHRDQITEQKEII